MQLTKRKPKNNLRRGNIPDCNVKFSRFLMVKNERLVNAFEYYVSRPFPHNPLPGFCNAASNCKVMNIFLFAKYFC